MSDTPDNDQRDAAAAAHMSSIYRDIFDVDKRGQAIFEDLVKRFARPQISRGGIDAVLQTYENGGMRKVIDYITLQINRANGVNDEETGS